MVYSCSNECCEQIILGFLSFIWIQIWIPLRNSCIFKYEFNHYNSIDIIDNIFITFFEWLNQIYIIHIYCMYIYECRSRTSIVMSDAVILNCLLFRGSLVLVSFQCLHFGYYLVWKKQMRFLNFFCEYLKEISVSNLKWQVSCFSECLRASSAFVRDNPWNPLFFLH